MPAIFSKNCILKGDLDSYCLVCSTHLPQDEDVLAHIRNSKHKASLTPIAYYEKFKDDYIRKVKGVYFCEVCNKTFSTTAKVGLHVTEETHIKGRRRRLTRVETSVVFQKNTLIEESSWNGLVEDACVLCNVEFDDYSTHISEHSHILNVVRSTATIDSDNNIYRKVEGGFHCLTCNKIVSENCITEHFKSTEHKGAVVKNDLSQHTESNKINAEEKVEKMKIKTEGNSDLLKEDSETQTLTTKKSSTDGKTLSSGPLLIKEKPTSSKSITPELETFAKQHGLSVNKFNYTVYCRVCSSQVPATMNCVKEHVLGKKHKDICMKNSFTSQYKKKNIKKINVKDFITTVSRVVNLEGMFIIINEEFFLKIGEFFGLSLFGGRLVCQFCHIDLNTGNFEEHIKSTLHRNLLDNSFVITSLENEFVRQVKSDLYHCGYCGIVESDFDEMMDHLASTRHKMSRAESEKMLQRLKMEELIRFSNFMSFLNHF